MVAFGPMKTLRGTILHDSYSDLDHQLSKLGRYARQMADTLMARGKHAGALRVLLEPSWRFLRAYILKRGYRDGCRGFALAQIAANYVWEKYLRLYVAVRAPRHHQRRAATSE